jgi:type VI secretion system protein ImpJ
MARPSSIPDRDPPPPALDIDADVRDTRIMLALPLRRTGMADVERSGGQQDTAARYRAVAREVRDNNVDTANNSAFVEVGEPRLRLFLDTPGFQRLRLHRDRPSGGKASDQRVVLDSDYCRPVWTAGRPRP